MGFPHGFDALIEALYDAVAIYNDKPQGGLLEGKSPREALKGFIDKGWSSASVDDETYDFVFSRRDTRTVRQGCIMVNNKPYVSNEIIKMGAGDHLDVRIPLRSTTRDILISHDNGPWTCAYPEIYYDQMDRAGAVEQRRRAKLNNAAVSDLKEQVDPKIDVHEEQKRFADRTPLATEHGSIIRMSDAELDGGLSAAAREQDRLERETKKDEAWSQVIAQAHKRKASGCNR